jgi:co-chaperonin GroES (HSP10)
MQKSKYLERFQKAKEAGVFVKDVILTGSFILVEKIPQEEVKTKSGIVLTASGNNNNVNSISANLPTMVYVLAVGAGHIDEDGNDVPLDVTPGDILMVGSNSVKWLPVLEMDGYQPFEIGLSTENETQIKIAGTDGYNRFIAALNGSSEGSQA